MLDVLQCDGDLISPPTPSCGQPAPRLGDFSSIFNLWNDWTVHRDDSDGGDEAVDEVVTDSEFGDTSTAVESVDTVILPGIDDSKDDNTTLSPSSSRSSTPRSPPRPGHAERAERAEHIENTSHDLPVGGLLGGLDFSLVATAGASIDASVPSLDSYSYDTADDADDDTRDSYSEDDRSVLETHSTTTPNLSFTPRMPPAAPNVRPSFPHPQTYTLTTSRGTAEFSPYATLYTPLAAISPLQPCGLFPLGTTSDMIMPSYWATSEEKLAILDTKLKGEYDKDRILSKKMPCLGTGSFDKSIHVFVDLSNIVIGFYLRIRTQHNISPSKRIPAPPFFFQALAQLIERGRPTVRKVTAGSVPDSGNRSGWPPYMDEAEMLGYEMNILSRVSRQVASAAPASSPRRQQTRPNKGRKNDTSHGNSGWPPYTAASGSSWDTSDESAADEGPHGGARGRGSPQKMGEQAVDEILQLKMCHSVLDHEPGTIVLATGDAAEAEFSDGFLRHVERALNRGWRVELVAWKSGISQAWRELKRRQKKEGQAQCFRIIELDTYVEELLGIFKNPSTPNWIPR